MSGPPVPTRHLRDVTHPVGYLFQAGNLQALSLLKDADEIPRVEQRLMRAGIQPSRPLTHDFSIVNLSQGSDDSHR